MHQDIWSNPEEPYINNLNEVYIKLEIDNEAVSVVQAKENFFSQIGIVGSPTTPLQEGEEPSEESKRVEEIYASVTSNKTALPGEREKPPAERDEILIACSPYPSNKALDLLPRYLTRITQVDCEVQGAAEKQIINQNYSSYFGGVHYQFTDAMAQ
jgi:hypothetical protein